MQQLHVPGSEVLQKKGFYLEPEFLMLHQDVISVKILHKFLLLCSQRLRSEKRGEKKGINSIFDNRPRMMFQMMRVEGETLQELISKEPRLDLTVK